MVPVLQESDFTRPWRDDFASRFDSSGLCKRSCTLRTILKRARGRVTVADEMASGDRAARAAICDLLEVTRQVMKPPSDNGTHWCAEVAPKQMVEWCLSELAEVEEEIERAEKAELAAKRRARSSDASALHETLSGRQDEGVSDGRRTEDAPEKRESEPSETDADATTPARARGGAEARDGASAATGAKPDVHAGTDSAVSVEVRHSRARVKDELGDLLFDVMMLACVCERRFGDRGEPSNAGVTVAGAAAHAAQKVKRRCPHVFGPLPGPAATRAEEEAEWKKAKAIEKAAVASGAALPPAPPTRRGCAGFARLFSIFVDEPQALVASAVAGTCFGVVLGAVLWRRHG